MKKWVDKIRAFLRMIDPFTYCDLLLNKYYPLPKNGKTSLVQESVYQGVYLLTAFLTAFVLFAAMGFILQTNSPIVIVVSESMEPTLHRGDLVLLHGVTFADLKADAIQVTYPLGGALFNQMGSVDYETGLIAFAGSNQNATIGLDHDIVVYNSPERGEQIIHRAQAKIQATDGDFIITKGDNPATNPQLDQDCQMVPFQNEAGVTELRLMCVSPYMPRMDQIAGKSIAAIPLVGCVKLWVFDDIPSLLFKQQLPEHFRGIC